MLFRSDGPRDRDRQRRGTLLSCAAQRPFQAEAVQLFGGSVQFVRLLLAKGARVNHQDDEGFSPLLYAAYTDRGDTAVVELLLKNGADKRLKDKNGRTARDAAKLMGHEAIVKLLEEKAPIADPTPSVRRPESNFCCAPQRRHWFRLPLMLRSNRPE